MKIEQRHFDAMMAGTECKFWDEDEHDCYKSKLLFIKTERIDHFGDDRGIAFENCEPIKPVMIVQIIDRKEINEN